MTDEIVVALGEVDGDARTRRYEIHGFCIKEVFMAYKRLADQLNDRIWRRDVVSFHPRSPFPKMSEPALLDVTVSEAGVWRTTQSPEALVFGAFAGITIPDAYALEPSVA